MKDGMLWGRRISAFVCGVFCAAAVVLPLSHADAQGSNEAGLGIQPAVYEEPLDPGSRDTFRLEITNRENREREIFLTPRNISSVGPGGRPQFTDAGAELTGYELASWLSFSRDSVVIPAGETRGVEVTINVPEDAPPGSHFGGVKVAADAPELRESGASVAYGVTNIVTVRVAGEADVRAIIRSLSTDQYVYGTPEVQFTARIENQGNVLIRPTGTLQIYGMLGQEAGKITFNEDRAGVFPEITRPFEIEWNDDAVRLGKYEAILSVAYGGEGVSRTMTSTVSFWVLPTQIVFPALAGLGILLLLTYLAVRLYVSRAVAHHGLGRRVKGGRRRTGMPLGVLLLLVMLVVTALFLLLLLLFVA
jgi:hypothetical protein